MAYYDGRCDECGTSSNVIVTPLIAMCRKCLDEEEHDSDDDDY